MSWIQSLADPADDESMAKAGATEDDLSPLLPDDLRAAILSDRGRPAPRPEKVAANDGLLASAAPGPQLRPALEARPIPTSVELLRRVYGREGLCFAIVVTLPLLLSGLPGLGLLAFAVHFIAVTSEMFYIVAHVGHNRPGLPMIFAEIGPGTGPIARSMQGLFLIVPTLLAVGQFADTLDNLGRGAEVSELLMWAVLTLAFAGLAPALVLTMTLSSSLMMMVNPLAWAKIILGVPRAYFACACHTAPLLVVGLLLRIDSIWVFFGFLGIDGLLRSLASVFVWMLASLLVGRFLLAQHEFFGQSLDRPLLEGDTAPSEASR